MTLSERNMLVGAGVFFVFSQVLEKGMHVYLLQANPVTAAWFRTHAIAFAVYASLAAGLFEESGRYLGMRLLVLPSGNPGTAVAYGIGHGGLESIFVGTFALAQAFAFSVLLDLGKLEAALGSSLPPEALNQVRVSLEYLTLGGLALGTFERLVALLLQIALSLIVWRAVEARQRHLRWLALAILFHAAIDFPAGLLQAGQISLLVAEAPIFGAGTLLAMLFLYKLPGRGAAQPSRT